MPTVTGRESLNDIDRKIFLSLEKNLIPVLQDKTPVKTGNAAEGWEIIPLGQETFLLHNPVPYVKFLEEGIQPHIISAKNKKFLRFKKSERAYSGPKRKIPNNQAFEKDGYVFAKKVWHPGFEALHFIQNTLNDEKLWRKIYDEVFK